MAWAPLPGFPGYEVSDRGIVRNTRTRKPLRATLSDSGYRRVRITMNSRCRSVLIHKSVLTAFKGHAPSARHQAAHVNGRKLCNRIDNLEWKLKEDNEKDKKLHGTVRSGRPTRTTAFVARRIRARAASGESFSAIGRSLGMHRSSIARIVKGHRWKIEGAGSCGTLSGDG